MGEGDRAEEVRVFVTHASEDAGLAAAVRDLAVAAFGLRRRDVFVSSVAGRRLQPGQPWGGSLRAEIGRSQIVLAVVTPAYLRSTYCTLELGAAWALDLPIVPILVGLPDDADIPAPLASFEYVGLTRDAPDRIVAAIQHHGGLSSDDRDFYHPEADALMEVALAAAGAPSPAPEATPAPAPTPSAAAPAPAPPRRPTRSRAATRMGTFDATGDEEGVCLLRERGSGLVVDRRGLREPTYRTSAVRVDLGQRRSHRPTRAALLPTAAGRKGEAMVVIGPTGAVWTRGRFGRWRATGGSVPTASDRIMTVAIGPTTNLVGLDDSGQPWVATGLDQAATPLVGPDGGRRLRRLAAASRAPDTLDLLASDGTSLWSSRRIGARMAPWEQVATSVPPSEVAAFGGDLGLVAVVAAREGPVTMLRAGPGAVPTEVGPLPPTGVAVVRLAVCAGRPGSVHVFALGEDGRVLTCGGRPGRMGHWSTVADGA